MTREKQVYSYEELPRVWLRRSQSQGHSPGDRMYFSGDTIYSYGSHFPIARFMQAPNGEEVILFTTDRDSRTTATHIHCVQSAVNHSGYRVVPCLDISATLRHEGNISAMKDVFDHAVNKLRKAHKDETRRQYSSAIYSAIAQGLEYCEVMCLEHPLWVRIPQGFANTFSLLAAVELHTEEKGETHA